MVRGFLFSILLTCSLPSLSAQESSLPPGAADRVAHILTERCVECHGKALAKPKGDFGFIEDLKMVTEDYVEPGDIEDSSLWTWLTDPDDIMPPEGSKAGPMTAEELALVRWWILEGAPAPTGPATAGKDEAPATAAAREEDLGDLHPMVVHFPVALLIMAAFAELLGLCCCREAMREVVRFCLNIGGLSTAAAIFTGQIAEDRPGEFPPILENHETGGWVCLALAAVCIAVNEARRRQPDSAGLRHGGRLLLLLLAITAGVVGHWGGELVH